MMHNTNNSNENFYFKEEILFAKYGTMIALVILEIIKN